MNKAGHNSTLTDDEQKALFFHHLQKRMAIVKEVKELNKEKSELAKVAKGDGVEIADLDYAIKTLDSEEILATSKFFAHAKVLTWLGMAPGFQADLFVDRAPALEKVKAKGYNAGLLGKTGQSDYPKGSNEDLEWLKGWDEAQKLMRDALQSAMEKKLEAEEEAKKPEFPDDPD